MTSVLDLHDSALRLWHGDALVESPGYAWFDGQHFRFGIPAMRTQRRTPREVNTRFWSQLNTQPLSPPLGQARHAADLVHAHLQDIHHLAGQPERLLIAAPGSMGRDALSLLLGIIEHLPFNVAGLVHRSAVLAAASGLPQGLHIELQLHQTQVTPFATEGQNVVVDAGQVVPGEGMLALQDRLATAIARSFVAQTRFDPLRSADGEQALYDALPGALESLRSGGEAQVSIGGYQARITQDDLQSVGAAYSRILEPLLGQDVPLLLESPLDLLPGLDLPTAHRHTSGGLLAAAIAKCETSLLQTTDQLALNRSVPVIESASTKASVTAAVTPPQSAQPVVAAQPLPSHVLIEHHARSLTDPTALPGTATLSLNDGAVAIGLGDVQGLQVNTEAAVEGQVLNLGDILSHPSGYHAVMIVVEG